MNVGGGPVHCHSKKEGLGFSLYLCSQGDQMKARSLVWVSDKKAKFRCLECEAKDRGSVKKGPLC